MKLNQRFTRGFTIIEVIVVIGIIGILTVIIFPSISNIRSKNRDTERIADISAIQLGLSLYYNKFSSYPETLDGLIQGNNKYVTEDSLIGPVSNDEYIYVPLKRSGATSDKCTSYHLGVKLESDSSQIDKADNFTTASGDTISNNYVYCGSSYSGLGIDGGENLIYHVHP